MTIRYDEATGWWVGDVSISEVVNRAAFYNGPGARPGDAEAYVAVLTHWVMNNPPGPGGTPMNWTLDDANVAFERYFGKDTP